MDEDKELQIDKRFIFVVFRVFKENLVHFLDFVAFFPALGNDRPVVF